VSIDGKPSRKVVEAGINALKAIWHRGAVDADGKTGDGAGIHVQIPPAFFYDQIRAPATSPREDELMAVGRCSCRAPISPRRKPAGPSSNRSAAHGLLHLWLAPRAGEHRPCSAKRPTRRGPRSSRS
jgi:glutamate synthase domain-containing protein 1